MLEAVAQPQSAERLPAKAASKSLRFRVILHGLCVIEQQPKVLRVYIPDLGSRHVYRAGNWLAETGIARGAKLTLKLPKGAATQSPVSFTAESNVIARGPFARSKSVRVYAEIELPRPHQIYSLRRVRLEKGDLTGKSLGRLIPFNENPPQRLATIQVLEYLLQPDDVNDVFLDSHPWIPVPLESATIWHMSLHIFAEPEVPQSPGHSIDEFKAAARLFKGLRLALARALPLPKLERPRPNAPSRSPGDGPDVLPEGLVLEELEDLISRSRRLALLGRYKNRNQDLNLIWDPDEDYGGNINACSSPLIDNPPPPP